MSNSLQNKNIRIQAFSLKLRDRNRRNETEKIYLQQNRYTVNIYFNVDNPIQCFTIAKERQF